MPDQPDAERGKISARVIQYCLSAAAALSIKVSHVDTKLLSGSTGELLAARPTLKDRPWVLEVVLVVLEVVLQLLLLQLLLLQLLLLQLLLLQLFYEVFFRGGCI